MLWQVIIIYLKKKYDTIFYKTFCHACNKAAKLNTAFLTYLNILNGIMLTKLAGCIRKTACVYLVGLSRCMDLLSKPCVLINIADHIQTPQKTTLKLRGYKFFLQKVKGFTKP